MPHLVKLLEVYFNFHNQYVASHETAAEPAAKVKQVQEGGKGHFEVLWVIIVKAIQKAHCF